MKNHRSSRFFGIERPRLLAGLIAAVIVAALLAIGLTQTTSFADRKISFLRCAPVDPVLMAKLAEYESTPTQLLAILHYATSQAVPQQSIDEIRVSFEVLRILAPCKFLVFGVGRDSLMWASLNPRGTTLFLEEDPEWLQAVLREAPILRAHPVTYRTQLSQANELLAGYKSEPDCLPSSPAAARLSRESRCRLALTQLPAEVYESEWDMIMIDAPKGYYAEAPGRMGAIYSAAVMARARVGPGVTHVFLHDVNRKVEKAFAEDFLCAKYRVKAVGRLWHFVIPPVANVSAAGTSFC